MGKRGSEDDELFKLVEAAFQDSDNDLTLALRVTKSQAAWGALSRATSKPRVLAITCKRSSTTQRFKVSIHVLKFSSTGLQPAKMYKLKHLSKVDVVSSDPTGCTFIMGFDNLKIQGSPPEWTVRSVSDRNRLLTTVIRLCKENLHRVPKIIGMDVVEMAYWEQARADSASDQTKADTTVRGGEQADHKVTVEKEMVSKAEEEDMETLLGNYVMGIDEAEAFSERLRRELLALEAANVHAILESEPLVEEVLKRLDHAEEAAEDMDEWLGIFNVKIKHMREDIESIESRNNMLEMQGQNNAALGKELNRLLERLRVPAQYASILTTGAFDESRVAQNVDACDWLSGAIRGLEAPILDPAYANMRSVKDKRAELDKLKSIFVRRASEFLRNFFSSLVEFMISDKTYFSQRGQLKRPDHADLRYKCRTYARLLQHMKGLEKGCLTNLRKAYCQSLNLLLRREAREFANELRASIKLNRNQAAWMDGAPGSSNSSGSSSGSDTSTASDAYAKMLRIFIPLLVDESAFFASFMCYEVLPLAPPSGPNGDEKGSEDDPDEDISPMNLDGTDAKPTEQNTAEMEALNQALQELLDGIQEDFYAVVDWAYKIDPLRCITMQGTTEKYLSSHKADAAGFVRRLLSDLQARISSQFSKFIDEACHQIERHDRGVRQTGVLSYIPRFASLAQRMEGLVHGSSRDMVDLAYTKLVGTMFSVLERIAQADPKSADVLLLENYAAFQNGLFDVANMVPTLAKFYQQASEAYEQACTRYVNSIINTQFDKLFMFGSRVENLLYTITPEEVPFQLGASKNELRKVLKTSLTGVEKSLYAMSKRMSKNLTSEELMPNLWEKCKIDFIEKYESLEAMLQRCYGNEVLSPSSTEMRELFKTV